MSDSLRRNRKNKFIRDKKTRSWILIETYFLNDNPNYKTQHQTDSF